MVICKYFQNGNCRFGVKCVNEHFDVKPIIKTEVEAALKGSQWPLSCFGPFKEKPCIPNFIEDQSFEEVRHLCYEAKKQNCFPAFHQQFTQQVMEAQNKMKTLLTLNRDVIEVVTNLYNSADTTKKTTQPGNPFSLAANTNSNQSNLFGNNPTQSNPFSNVGATVFGGSTPSNTNSIFGAQSSNTNSIIGQSSFGAGFGNSQGSVFGQQTSSFGQSGGNLFSMGSQQQQQSQQQQSSLFGGNTQTQQSSLGSTTGFGAASQTNLFGQPQQQQQHSLPGRIEFSQRPYGFGLFTQSPVQPQQTSTLEVQQFPMATGLFNQQQQQQPQQSQNVFGSPQPQQNLFGQQPNQQNTFGAQQQSNNLFGTQQSAPQQQNLPTSVFGNTPQGTIQPQNTLAPSTFGNLQQSQHQQQPENLFGQESQISAGYPVSNQPTFGNTITDIPFSETLYSKMEALKTEEIEAFKADKFELGKIPTNPPPRELVQFTMKN